MATESATLKYKDDKLVLAGEWTLHGIGESLIKTINSLHPPSDKLLQIEGDQITAIDTGGVWLINNLLEKLAKQNINVELKDFRKQHRKLLDLVAKQAESMGEIPKPERLSFLARLGKSAYEYVVNLLDWLTFIGEVAVSAVEQWLHPRRIRWAYLFKVIELNGYHALPIIGFLSFLIGVVLTYQIGLELKLYGANIFIINLLGMAILREFGPLITAIIVTGRTGAAFTAQLGVMKVNEEVDALRTMGHSPVGMLILPRIFGMILVMPLLTVWADVFGIAGGMIMSKFILNIGYHSFLSRFPSAVTLTTFMIGMVKAPVFALIIASVGCYHGFQVKGSSESIGLETTKSVVLAIFFIIVADAIFSIIFTWLNI